MTAYLQIALGLIRLISKLMEWSDQAYWMNEGAKQEAAANIAAASAALAKAAGVEAQYNALTDAELQRKIEDEGWYRD